MILIMDRQALLTAATRATAISAAVASKTTPVRLTVNRPGFSGGRVLPGPGGPGGFS